RQRKILDCQRWSAAIAAPGWRVGYHPGAPAQQSIASAGDSRPDNEIVGLEPSPSSEGGRRCLRSRLAGAGGGGASKQASLASKTHEERRSQGHLLRGPVGGALRELEPRDRRLHSYPRDGIES